MEMKKCTMRKALIAVTAAMAVMVISLAACPGGNSSTEEQNKAEAPFISVQPTDYQLNIGEKVELSVTARVSDGGSLSYQWYKAAAIGRTGTIVVGAETRVFSPPTDAEGTSYYYVEVSN
jgi:hypothetical protein